MLGFRPGALGLRSGDKESRLGISLGLLTIIMEISATMAITEICDDNDSENARNKHNITTTIATTTLTNVIITMTVTKKSDNDNKISKS